tara:strand:+ start:89 stop:559 length:471 start_codon:yes stop_codon:yes gene_type:complete
MPKIKPDIKELLKTHNLKKEDVWDCHGTWVLYHKSIERIQLKEKIVIVDLTVEYIDLALSSCVVKCTAVKDGIKVITFGECTPKNNRNSYPVAMAEKRAIDRAVLKLTGMHGDFYSEDEMNVSPKHKGAENNDGDNAGADVGSLPPEIKERMSNGN